MAINKPNILLIIGDDVGVDTLHIDDANDRATVQLTGTAAYPLPTISRLVSKGVHFTRAWAHPICAPSRATLFTGLHPWKTGIGDAAAVPEPILPDKLLSDGTTDLKTLGEFVSAAGYRCGFFGKWDLGKEETKTPTARGWHRFEGILEGGLRFLPENPPNRASYEQIIQQDVRYVSWEKVVLDVSPGFVRQDLPPEERPYKYATEDQFFSARDWIKQQQEPWWVTLAVISPHDPFHVPPAGTYTIQFKDPAHPTIQEMFAAMMESMDYYMGKFFDDPNIQNQLKNTVIIFIGDNGTQDELDGISGDDKSSVYIGGVHVPLLIADGGAIFGNGPCYLDAGQMSSEKGSLLHIVDLFQTIIDIASPSPSGPNYKTDSISMLPYLKQTSGDPRVASWQGRVYNLGQFYAPPAIPPRYQKLGERATISDGRYKLNYQNGQYEFSELSFDPATDIITETVTNQFQHPKARELWQVLTTPGSPYYIEVDDKGKKFPPLPETGSQQLGMVAFGNGIKLRHAATGLLLHSHSLNYCHPGTSWQQQVTCFGGADANDDWKIKGPHGQSEDFGTGDIIRHGSIVRLEHVNTRRNLHSHSGIPSPYTHQQEVTAFGDRIGDQNDNWRVEVEGGGIAYTSKRIKFIHVNTNQALHSHNVPANWNYTAGQQEVTCFGGRDDNDWWYLINS